MKAEALASERVIINAPMSFTGAAQRAWRLRGRTANPWAEWLVVTPLVVVMLVCWWVVIFVWYVLFGILLIPYRLFRRGARKRRKTALQHRETLEMMERTARKD